MFTTVANRQRSYNVKDVLYVVIFKQSTIVTIEPNHCGSIIIMGVPDCFRYKYASHHWVTIPRGACCYRGAISPKVWEERDNRGVQFGGHVDLKADANYLVAHNYGLNNETQN